MHDSNAQNQAMSKVKVPMLCGWDQTVEWNVVLDSKNYQCKMTDEGKESKFGLHRTSGGHVILDLDLLGKEENVFYMDKEVNTMESDENTYIDLDGKLCTKEYLESLYTGSIDENDEINEGKVVLKSEKLVTTPIMDQNGIDEKTLKVKVLFTMENKKSKSLLSKLKDKTLYIKEYKKIQNIHRLNNHKLEDNMMEILKHNGKGTRKVVNDVIRRCKICQTGKKNKPRPKIAFMKAKSFNDVVTMDLKQVGKSHILWMICSFSRLVKGIALKTKTAKEIVKGMDHGWLYNIGCPTTGFWADNGTEFKNEDVKKLCKDWGISIKFGAPYSPWSNGLNERNHASCDVTVKKLMEENRKMSLQEAVDRASWTHNTNVSTTGVQPLMLMTGKAVKFPGVRKDNLEEFQETSEHLENLYRGQNEFLRSELRRKIVDSEKIRVDKYHDNMYEKGEQVLVQLKEEKEWTGPCKVVESRSNEVKVELDGDLKRIHPSRVEKYYEEIDEDLIVDKHVDKTGNKGILVDKTGNNGILTRSKSKGLRFIDSTEMASYWIKDSGKLDFKNKRKLEEKLEWIDEDEPEFNLFFMNEIFVIELPVREHGRKEVLEAKEKEIQNLRNYEVFEEVQYVGQETIGTRWVITMKEDHDGQKTKYKARLVAQGYKELEKAQSDSPTAQRESFRLFLAVAATIRIQALRSIDISAAFLQSDNLKRDVFVKIPKDIEKENIVWKLKKPLYGLTDAGRKFWLKVRSIVESNGYEKLKGDEAFYFKHKDGKLSGMLLLHVDDFMMAGSKDFVEETTEMFRKTLTISKVEDNSFRFCGVDVQLRDGRIDISMEDYTKSLCESKVDCTRKKNSSLNSDEISELRSICGKISWLAENCRPDLQFNALELSRKNREATIADLKYANTVIKKARSKTSKITYGCVGNVQDIVIYGIGDASYKAGERSIGGQLILIGNKYNDRAVPVLWKSKLIRKVCKSPKDAETVNLGILVDMARHTANQVGQILYGKNGIYNQIKVRILTDNLGVLESIASSHQVERRTMRSDIADLKQQLEDRNVDFYAWCQDERMISDILTKDKKEKFGLDGLIRDNRLEILLTRDNMVTYSELDNDYIISGRRLRDRIAPRKGPPMRKKLKTAAGIKTETGIKKKEDWREEQKANIDH